MALSLTAREIKGLMMTHVHQVLINRRNVRKSVANARHFPRATSITRVVIAHHIYFQQPRYLPNRKHSRVSYCLNHMHGLCAGEGAQVVFQSCMHGGCPMVLLMACMTGTCKQEAFVQGPQHSHASIRS